MTDARNGYWSSLTLDAIQPLLSLEMHGMGYLIWVKIDHACLAHANFKELYDRAQSTSHDPILRAIADAKHVLETTIKTLRTYGIRRVCLGVSWCDWVSFPGGAEWIRTYIKAFAAHFEVLPRITYTPPGLTNGGTINAPPQRLVAFAEFLHRDFLKELGHLCGPHIELWNEFNLDTDWVRARDPNFAQFMTMVGLASLVCRHHGKKVVLGGVTAGASIVQIFAQLAQVGFTGLFDAVGYHDLRGTWSDHVPSPPIKDQVSLIRTLLRSASPGGGAVARLRNRAMREEDPELRSIFQSVLDLHQSRTPDIWLTEYGFPVADPYGTLDLAYLETIQAALFAYATYSVANGDIARVYWYTHRDFVGETVRKHTTGWEDVLQHYYGDRDVHGTPRLLGRLLEHGGPAHVLSWAAEHAQFHLVDAASLKRTLPGAYVPQESSNHDVKARV